MNKSMRAKAFAQILIIGLVLSVAAVYISFRIYDSTVDSRYSDFTMKTSRTEALVVDGDLMDIFGHRVMEIYKAYCEENSGSPDDLESMSPEEQDAYCALYDEVYEMDGYEEIQAELIPFREHEFEMNPGDTLFVYTDGVPEATSAVMELYGTDRMLDVLNANKGRSLEQILHAVKSDIDRFVAEAPQFDDITMLGFDYYGRGGAQQ